jgi:hypothetical protein
LALVSRSLTRLEFHTSDFESFVLVARILESSELYALTHMTVTHVIQEHEQAGFRGGSFALREGYPRLTSVHLRFLFVTVYPVDIDDQRNLRTSMPFLRACDANDILHHEFCGIVSSQSFPHIGCAKYYHRHEEIWWKKSFSHLAEDRRVHERMRVVLV